MQKIINKSTAIKAVLTIIGLCLIFTIFPFGIWSQIEKSSLPRSSNEKVGPVTQDKLVTQSFTAEYSHLDSIYIYLAQGTQGESFSFSMVKIFENEERPMFEDVFLISQDDIPGFYDVLVDQSLEIGETYKYIIKAETEPATLFLGIEWFLRDDYPNLGRLYYDEKPWSGQGLVAVYNYTVPISTGYSLALIAAILLLITLLSIAVNRYYRKNPGKDSLLTVEQVVKIILNPLVIVLVIIGLVAVCLQTFGPYLFDNIFFAVAVLTGGAICWYGINHNRDGQAPIITKEVIRKNWPDYLQSVLFAGAIYACCEYMCAQITIHQTIAQSKQIIYFGLIMLMMMGFRQIFNLINLIFLTIIGGYGYYFYTEKIQAGMGELNTLELEEIRLAAWVFIIGGMVIVTVIINVITRLIKKEMKPISVPFGCLMLLFLSLMVVFRNTREWPILMAVCFTLFYLQYSASRKMDITLNICRGLILSFLWMVGYSLLYRPFATFQTVRFPMMFNSVTVAATYLAVVATAALIILLKKMRESNQLKDLWKECLLLGTALTYLTFTISNTGIYAFTVTAIFSLLMFTAGKSRERLKSILSAAGLMIMSLIVCFPVIFFMQRNIPALVGKPAIYSIESFHQEITRGRNPASYEHMRVGRFIEVFGHEFLGIPENRFDFYGHIRAYEEERVIINSEVFSLDKALEMGLDVENAIPLSEKKHDLLENPGAYTEEDLQYYKDNLGIIVTESDFSNGRIDHFRAYFAELNAFGHNSMSVIMPDGSQSYHAHNIYLQFAYDHGIYMGILFIIVGGAAFIRAVMFYRRYDNNVKYAALPLAVIVVVATAGLAEWIFHFSNPSGFMLMLMMAPLTLRFMKEQNEK
ncbi:MAG: hypothetical protein FWE14_00915 [Lachnospiraceae bacterium]|nr:hypothetical protein [Lachnospiraceae bacterium]